MINLLSKQELNILNRRSLKYQLAIAEKDYFLAIVSKIIFDSPLRNKLIFKGGTAIHHCYIPHYRFSEDLDFTAIAKNITLEEIKTVLESNDFINIKKEYKSESTIKLERVQYTGPLGMPNYLKVEVDYTQNVVLPAVEIEYKNAWGVKTNVMAMDIREICAEKIRACNERARYRDFYDLFLIFEVFSPKWNEVIDLIGRKEMRKPMSKEAIRTNWLIAIGEKAEEVAKIHYSRVVADEQIEQFITGLPVL